MDTSTRKRTRVISNSSSSPKTKFTKTHHSSSKSLSNTFSNSIESILDGNTDKDNFIDIDIIKNIIYNILKLKDIFKYETMINILMNFNTNNKLISKELDIKNHKFKKNKDYGSNKYFIVLLTIFDLLGLKVFYIMYSDEQYYVSFLNDKKIRNYIRKLEFKKLKLNNNFILKKSILELKKKINITSDFFNNYDLIICHNYYNIDLKKSSEDIDKYIFKINNINNFLNINYKTSMLASFDHVISIVKCNDNYILNYNINNNLKTFFIKDFNFNNNTYYEEFIQEDSIYDYCLIKKNLSELTSDKTKIYKSFNYDVKNKLKNLFINIHFFYINKTLKNYKFFSGGNCDELIVDNDMCKNSIINNNNRRGYCWFGSIINSLCYSDIAYIILNKSNRFIKKSIDFIKSFFDDVILKKKSYINLDKIEHFKSLLKSELTRSIYTDLNNKLLLKEYKSINSSNISILKSKYPSLIQKIDDILKLKKKEYYYDKYLNNDNLEFIFNEEKIKDYLINLNSNKDNKLNIYNLFTIFLYIHSYNHIIRTNKEILSKKHHNTIMLIIKNIIIIEEFYKYVNNNIFQ